jgi:DNA-binding transcriptional LysR family regulator
MELRQLQYFDRVIAAGGFRSAARELGVTQPTLTAQIRRLELDLGVRLVDRTRRPIRTTPAGEIVAARVRELLASIARFDTDIARIAEQQTGRLRLGTNRALAPMFSSVLAEFSARYPNVEVIQQSVTREGPKLLLRGELDVCVHTLPAARESLPRQLESARLFTFEQVFAVLADHPLAGSGSVSLTELAHERLVLSTGISGEILKQAFAAADIVPQVVFETDDLDIVASLVAQGIGVGFVPEFMLKRAAVELKTFTVPHVSYSGDAWLTWATRLRDSPALGAFVAFVTAQPWSFGAPRRPHLALSDRNLPTPHAR